MKKKRERSKVSKVLHNDLCTSIDKLHSLILSISKQDARTALIKSLQK